MGLSVDKNRQTFPDCNQVTKRRYSSILHFQLSFFFSDLWFVFVFFLFFFLKVSLVNIENLSRCHTTLCFPWWMWWWWWWCIRCHISHTALMHIIPVNPDTLLIMSSVFRALHFTWITWLQVRNITLQVKILQTSAFQVNVHIYGRALLSAWELIDVDPVIRVELDIIAWTFSHQLPMPSRSLDQLITEGNPPGFTEAIPKTERWAIQVDHVFFFFFFKSTVNRLI